MVPYEGTSSDWARAGAAAANAQSVPISRVMRRGIASSLCSLVRQRNEFRGVARHDIEAAGFPVGLGGFDAFLARGDEIPPDVARAVHGGAADHDEVGIACRPDRYRIARLEHQ